MTVEMSPTVAQGKNEEMVLDQSVEHSAPSHARLRIRRVGLHTQREPIAIVRSDCPVCRSEGFAQRSQVLLRTNGREVAALLFQGLDDSLRPGEIGLSEAAWALLDAPEGHLVSISHLPPLHSMVWVRSRIHGGKLDQGALDEILRDVVAGYYSDVQLAAFITSCSALPLDDEETIALTSSMIRAGDVLSWDGETIDKHSVGGLPGNRTTPIVVAIAAAAGLRIPKTSSRAITSPAGTADAMETVTQVELSLPTIRKVVETEGGCLAWGGGLHLSPADDIFIGVERQLDIDPEGQLIASVLSKKIAAGATRLVLDIPVGATAKVRTRGAASRLAKRMVDIAAHFGVKAVCVLSDGREPVGRSIGPALEMMDVLSVLRLESEAPEDLRERALKLAAEVLELGGAAKAGQGMTRARELLSDGSAYGKFERICLAQGGFREPARARLQRAVAASTSGEVVAIDNRKIARIAKFAGAPDSPTAGLRLHARLGDMVNAGDPLFTLHAEMQAELDYAFDYACSVEDAIELAG